MKLEEMGRGPEPSVRSIPLVGGPPSLRQTLMCLANLFGRGDLLAVRDQTMMR